MQYLGKGKDNWVEKLPAVLWAYRMTKRIPTVETPFSLAYGTEAIILVDMPTPRKKEVDWDQDVAQL